MHQVVQTDVAQLLTQRGFHRPVAEHRAARLFGDVAGRHAQCGLNAIGERTVTVLGVNGRSLRSCFSQPFQLRAGFVPNFGDRFRLDLRMLASTDLANRIYPRRLDGEFRTQGRHRVLVLNDARGGSGSAFCCPGIPHSSFTSGGIGGWQ